MTRAQGGAQTPLQSIGGAVSETTTTLRVGIWSCDWSRRRTEPDLRQEHWVSKALDLGLGFFLMGF
jgi:hypothetical protein